MFGECRKKSVVLKIQVDVCVYVWVKSVYCFRVGLGVSICVMEETFLWGTSRQWVAKS